MEHEEIIKMFLPLKNITDEYKNEYEQDLHILKNTLKKILPDDLLINDECEKNLRIIYKNEIENYNRSINKLRNKFFYLLEEKCIKFNFNVEMTNKVRDIGNFLFSNTNYNFAINPLMEYKYLFLSNDIKKSTNESCNKNIFLMRINLWNEEHLEQKTLSTKNEINLVDAIGIKSWSVVDMEKEKLNELIKLGQIFTDVGLDVFYFDIGKNDIGYDYHVIKFEPNKPSIILEHKKSDYFRIYINKQY